MVEESCGPFSHLAHEKGIEIVTHLPEAFCEEVIGDPSRIRQVLNNLLSNAVKFSDHGTVDVKLEQVGLALGHADFRISVSDHGIGIPASRKSAIFEGFTQADGSTTRKYGGTGLGLTICRHLAELMDAKIGLESEEGIGSVFWLDIRLPRASAQVAQQPGVSVASAFAHAADEEKVDGMRVLVAEDNLVNQKVVVRLLERWGVVVNVAGNGREAIDILEQTPFDVVFMDCHMPVMDGYEATRQIRSHSDPRVSHARIVALTANAMTEDRANCLKAGMDDYMSKPISPDKVRECLKGKGAAGHAA